MMPIELEAEADRLEAAGRRLPAIELRLYAEMRRGPVVVPLDEWGAPDLQLFIRACGTRYAHLVGEKYNPKVGGHGGYQHISPEDWRAWDEAIARWQVERRAAYARSIP